MLKKHAIMGIEPSTYLVVLHSLKQYSLAELLEAVLIHLDSGDILMLLDVDVSNIEPNVGKFGGRLPNFGEDHSSFSYVTWNSINYIKYNILCIILKILLYY